jgi:hypothetical protein
MFRKAVSLSLSVIRASGSVEPGWFPGLGGAFTDVPARHLSLKEVARHGAPQRDLPEEVNQWRERNWPRLLAQALRINAGVSFARRMGLLSSYGRLSLAVIRSDGRVLDYGLASMRVVTTAGVNFLTDALQNLVEAENLKFHGIGTGTNAEAVGDTALQTELTTQYNPDSTRATGSQTENGANVYRTVGTNTVDGTAAVTEHGIFSQAATGGGSLLDRSVFTAINLASGDGVQSTYDFTQTAGS